MIFFIITGCGGIRKGTKITSESQKDIGEGERFEITRLFLEATKERIAGNWDLAAGIYSQCIRKDPDNSAAMYELARLYILLQKHQEALYFAKKAAEISPSNQWYMVFVAELYKNNREFDEAEKMYEKLIRQYPENINYLYDLANMLSMTPKHENALDAFNRIEKQIGVTEDVSLQKERLYIGLNKIDKAATEMQRLIDAYPDEPRYYGMLAELYQANNMNDKALETYKKLLEIDPENAIVHLSLADYYRSAGDNAKSFSELKIAFSSPHADIDTKVKILLSYYAITEFAAALKEQAMTLCELLTKAHPTEAKSYAIYGDFLVRDKRFQEARVQYRKALTYDKSKFLIWQQLLSIDYELQDFESLARESSEALELFPSQAQCYLMNGIANIRLGRHKEALHSLETGVSMVAGDSLMISQFYSTIGDSYHASNDTGSSDIAYEKALEHDSNNVYVLNNYSYYLSMRKENLEKAKKMAKKANDLMPENNSFQDTYGWVLYYLSDFEEAEKWISKSLSNGGDQKGIVLEHYGDVLYRLGENEKATEYWEKAKKQGGGSELLDRKIMEKKLFD